MNTRASIIIIEDEKNICSFIETILEAHGYVTSTATNGNDGIALIASTKPSVVLLDLGLPDIDGLEVIRRVRLWSTVPIIVISARTWSAARWLPWTWESRAWWKVRRTTRFQGTCRLPKDYKAS